MTTKGKIQLCPKDGCEWLCCSNQVANGIMLYPGELENALKNGYSMEHLEIVKSYGKNGVRVSCIAKDKTVCDNGYKPLTCKFFPLFPISTDEDYKFVSKDRRCPLFTKEDVENEVENLKENIALLKKGLAEMIDVSGKETIERWLQMISKIQLLKFDLIDKVKYTKIW